MTTRRFARLLPQINSSHWIAGIVAVIALCISATGQACSNPPESPKSERSIGKDDIKSCEPSIPGRIGRMFNYQYGLAEQPASIVATANGTSQIIPNPEGYLNQHQLGF